MKDFVDRFAYSDFAVYFFPGLFFICGFVPLLLVTSARATTLNLLGKLGIAGAVVVLPVAYALGGILAGFRPTVVNLLSYIFWPKTPKPQPRAEIYPEAFKACVSERFCNLFRVSSSLPWSVDHFHCARAWVEQRHPAVATLARRQNALASFRENLIMPALVWCISGIVWVLNTPSFLFETKAIVSAFFVLAAVLVPWTLLQRARLNREREVREVCLGILISEVSEGASNLVVEASSIPKNGGLLIGGDNGGWLGKMRLGRAQNQTVQRTDTALSRGPAADLLAVLRQS